MLVSLREHLYPCLVMQGLTSEQQHCPVTRHGTKSLHIFIESEFYDPLIQCISGWGSVHLEIGVAEAGE